MIPEMKAILYEKYGSPDVLSLKDVPKPVPGDNEVLVKIQAVSINSWDWDMLTGKPVEYRFISGLLKPKSQLIHGCDIAGTIESVGKNIKNLQVGDDVFGDLGEGGWGAFAEYICVREEEVIIKPSSMSFEEAACLSHGGNLAVQGLIDFGKINPGQRVLINGGGGSTGTLAIQIAKLFDTEVTVVDSRDKFEMMSALGADHLIDFTTEDFTQNEKTYDLIFDVKTTRSIFNLKQSLNPNGTYVTVGGKTTLLFQLVFLRKLISKNTFHMVSYKPNKDLKYLVELFEAGKLKLTIDKRFPLEKTPDAFRYYGEGSFNGKIVVTVEHS